MPILPLLTTPLVSPETALAHVQAIRWIDARAGAAGRAAFALGRVRGAVHADLDSDLAAPAPDPACGGRHPLPTPADFAARVGAWGIGPDTFVVVYDDQGGALAAARAWWMLRALGHAHVAVLDGGVAAARAVGLSWGTSDAPPAPRPPYPHAGRWLLPTASADETDAARCDPARRVIDVRAAPRFRGEVEPIDPVAGHIPGACNAPYTDLLAPDGRLLPPDELRERVGAATSGIAVERAVVHCGSGVTACHFLLAVDALKWPLPALYVGSWSEWCRQPARLRAVG